nr:MMPL family transporter [Corynebacterium frankenforstense]
MTSTRMKAFRWLALLLIALGIGAMAIGAADKPNSPTATLPDGFDSTRVAELQQQASEDEAGSDGEANSQAAVVLFNTDDGATLQPDALATLQQRAEELGGPLIPSEDATAAIVPVEVTSEGLTENADAVTELRDDAAADLPEGVSSQVTGPAAVEADLSGVFSGANVLLLSVTGAIVAVLLIVTYRSPVLWLLPLIVIGIADRVAATVFTWVLSATGTVWNESTAGILSVLVFGAGTNYALLLISRYREELAATDDRFAAMARAWTPTLRTVTASASTVVLGVACLLASVVPTTRGLGLSAMIGIVVAFIFAMFVLPGVLVTFGRWVFWPRIPKVGDEPEHKLWDKVAGFVEKKPVAVTVTSLIVIGAACTGALGITTGLNQSDQFLDTPESITAAEDLEAAFPEQDATPAHVATRDAAAATTALEDAGATVREQGTAGEYAMLSVSNLDTNAAREALSGVGSESLVGGQDAQLVDAEEAAARDRTVVFPLILGLIFIALVFLLRSFLAPLIMTATVLLTNIAALGLGWWVSTGIFGFDRFDSTTPLYAFVFLVALGIDYSIFLVTRAKEEAAALAGDKVGGSGVGDGDGAATGSSAEGGSVAVGVAAPGEATRRGVLRALSATGGVITSAGILLASVFAALGVLPLVVLAQIGIVIFLGVLLDTLVVRTLLIPAVVQLLGEKFWWPAKPFAKVRKDEAAA